MAIQDPTIHPFLLQGFHICPECNSSIASGADAGSPSSCLQCEALGKLRCALLRECSLLEGENINEL